MPLPTHLLSEPLELAEAVGDARRRGVGAHAVELGGELPSAVPLTPKHCSYS
jgi:hypothetical protein